MALVDPAQNVTTYKYDGLDRITAETTLVDSVLKSRSREYNALGQLAVTVDRNGRGTVYLYDRLDRVTTERWYADGAAARLNYTPASSNPAYSDSVTWIFDSLGRVKEQQYVHRLPSSTTTDYRVTDSYVYDGLDRLVEHSNQSLQPTNPPHSTGVPALKQTYAYGYDAGGLVETREQFVGGQFAAQTKSHYNAFGELVKIEDRDTRAAGPSTILDFEGTDAVFTYLGDGSLKSATRFTDWDGTLGGYRNEVRSDYAYDRAGRLASIAHQQRRRTTAAWPAQTPLATFGYTYDAAGRIDGQGSDWNQSLAAFASRGDEWQGFTYDAAGQLTHASSTVHSTSTYGYSANGNRTSATEPGGGTDAYTPGTQNRIAATNDSGSGRDYRYEYDAEGNVTSRIEQIPDGAGGTMDGGSLTTYAWDHRNRLTRVVQVNQFGGGHVESVDYRYAAGGDLVYRQFDTTQGNPPPSPTVEYYVAEGGERTMTLTAAGQAVRRYLHGPADQVLVDQTFNQPGGQEHDALLPLGDHLNSTRVLLAHDANDAIYVSQSADYDPFGRVRSVRDETGTQIVYSFGPAAALKTAVHFGGELHDHVSQLSIHGQRWYDAELGRFMSVDPARDGSNWYKAFGNNPIIYVDPTGLYQQGHPLQGGSRQLDSFLRNSVNTAIAGPSTAANSAPSIDRSQLDVYANQMAKAGTLRSSLQSQLSATHNSLANRSFYEVFDKRADRARIATLQDQLVDAIGQHSAARSNYTQLVNGWQGQRSNYEGYQYQSTAAAFGSGLGTGGKAVGNSFGSTLSLGYYDGPFTVTQQDLDNGYNTSRFIAGISSELLVGVATGGASRYGRVGKAALAFDTAGNAVGAGRGVADAYQNGLGYGNSLQIVGGAAGLGGNVAAGGRQLGEMLSDASRVRVSFDPATLSTGGLGGVKVHLNTSTAVGNFGVYDISVNGQIHKIGKADLDRITQSSKLPTRVHQQVRELRKVFGAGSVQPGEIIPLGRVTTAQAKLAETARIQAEVNSSGFIPLGNWKSFRP